MKQANMALNKKSNIQSPLKATNISNEVAFNENEIKELQGYSDVVFKPRKAVTKSFDFSGSK